MASDSPGGDIVASAPADVAASAALSVTPNVSVVEPRKIAVAAADPPAAVATVDRRAPLVVGPPAIVLADESSVGVRSYRPPIPRGGSAQPLLSRDR